MSKLSLIVSNADLAHRNPAVADLRATLTVAEVAVSPDVPVDVERLAGNLLVEFRAAWSTGDHDQMSAVMLAAHELDTAHPDEPRLMDEIRGIRNRQAAYLAAA